HYHKPLDNIDRVVSIVCPSRSGSSFLKKLLSYSEEIMCLAGEEEPYYKLCCNGHPWHKSDKYPCMNSPDRVKALIGTELLNYESAHNRLLLQRYDIEERPFVPTILCRSSNTLLIKTPQNVYRKKIIESLFPGREMVYI